MRSECAATNGCGQLLVGVVYRIPGKLSDRKTPLGELNWIFTAITDTIAWNTLPQGGRGNHGNPFNGPSHYRTIPASVPSRPASGQPVPQLPVSRESDEVV